MSSINRVTDITQYRRNKDKGSSTLSLFDTRKINIGIIKVYVCDGKFALIKINNNRIYRIGPSFESILVHNIPNQWQCIAVYKGLTFNNLCELSNILFKRN